MSTSPAEPALPLFRRFPALERIPRAMFGTFPTPLERVSVAGREMLLKRDDLSGAIIGGNKLRGLEFLLGDVRANDRVLTVGPRGSTHALATARCGRVLGADVTVVRWNQEMNDAARRVDQLLRREARVLDARWVPAAYVTAFALRSRPRVQWVPAGGASPLALLGHVNAALELAEQLETRRISPDVIVLPLGTGGTAAGLALGLRIAGVSAVVCAVRVVPRIVGRARRVIHLADAAARIIERLSGERLPRVGEDDLRVEHAYYGGGYGRPLGERAEDSSALDRIGIALDDTYSRKAFTAAARMEAELPLMWLTFDGRLLHH